MGERTTDLRVFAGHKVTHTVSTQNASRAAQAKLQIMGGHSKAKMETCVLSGGFYGL